LPEAYQNYGTLGATAVYAGQVRDVNAYNQTLKENVANTYNALGRQAEEQNGTNSLGSSITNPDSSNSVLDMGGIQNQELVRQAKEREQLEETGSPFKAVVKTVDMFTLSPIRGAAKLLYKPAITYGTDPDIRNFGFVGGALGVGLLAPEVALVATPYLIGAGSLRAIQNPTPFTVTEAATFAAVPFIPGGFQSLNRGEFSQTYIPRVRTETVPYTLAETSSRTETFNVLGLKDLIPKSVSDSVKTAQLKANLATQNLVRQSDLLGRQITYNTFRPVAEIILLHVLLVVVLYN